MESGITGQAARMNIWLILAGALLLVWPLEIRRAIPRIHERMAAQGEDPARFDRLVGRWLRRVQVIAPILGALCVVAGVAWES